MYRNQNLSNTHILNEIRLGRCSEELSNQLRDICMDRSVPFDVDANDIVHLYPTKDEVEHHNERCLSTLDGLQVTFIAVDSKGVVDLPIEVDLQDIVGRTYDLPDTLTLKVCVSICIDLIDFNHM